MIDAPIRNCQFGAEGGDRGRGRGAGTEVCTDEVPFAYLKGNCVRWFTARSPDRYSRTKRKRNRMMMNRPVARD